MGGVSCSLLSSSSWTIAHKKSLLREERELLVMYMYVCTHTHTMLLESSKLLFDI